MLFSLNCPRSIFRGILDMVELDVVDHSRLVFQNMFPHSSKVSKWGTPNSTDFSSVAPLKWPYTGTPIMVLSCLYISWKSTNIYSFQFYTHRLINPVNVTSNSTWFFMCIPLYNLHEHLHSWTHAASTASIPRIFSAGSKPQCEPKRLWLLGTYSTSMLFPFLATRLRECIICIYIYIHIGTCMYAYKRQV